MRSFGGYGQRSRSARAATGCGPRVLRLPARPLPRGGHPNRVYRKPRVRTHDRDAHTPNIRDRHEQNYSFFNLLYLLIFIIFSHFDILFFS